MSPSQHLIDLNTRLIATLDVAEGGLPDPVALDALLAAREVLMEAVKHSTPSLSDAPRRLLTEQHRRIDGLVSTHTGTVRQHLQRLGLLDRARSEYATPSPRQVLRTGLNG